ncbi:unnamed protein product [Calicophoron daubneyi]|uniref:Uncharacterized protein n=1 Tax=Calicophoron daubneyi TaxID=300641 RepID=A0AAV2T6M4_CALDB
MGKSRPEEGVPELDCMVRELVECMQDPSEVVRDAIRASLIHLGLKDAELVLRHTHSFLKRGRRKNDDGACTTALLTVVESILREKIDELNVNIPLGTIPTLFGLISDVEDLANVQKAATSVLVQLSSRFLKEVVEELLSRLHNNTGHTRSLIEVSGQIVANHAHKIAQFLPLLITQIVRYIDQGADDSSRASLIVTLGQYCDSALEYLAVSGNTREGWENTVELLSPHTCPFVDIMLTTWLPAAKDPQLLMSILSNIGSISSLTDQEHFSAHLPKILGCLTSHLKKSSPQLDVGIVNSVNALIETVAKRIPISDDPSVTTDQSSKGSEGRKSFSVRLSTSPPKADEPFEFDLDDLMASLFQKLVQCFQRRVMIDNPTNYSATTKTLNEIKRAFNTLLLSYPARVLAFVQSHMNSSNEHSCAMCLELLRHLVSSNDQTCFTDEVRQSILGNLLRLLFYSTTNSPPAAQGATSLKKTLMGGVVSASPLASDRDSLILGEVAAGEHLPASVRCELAKTVLTIGSLGYLESDGGRVLVEFIVRQCAAPSLSTSEKMTGGSPTQRQIREICTHILKLGSTTVESMRSVLWPFLLEFIMAGDCTDAMGVLCDSIANILSKPMSDASISGQPSNLNTDDSDIPVASSEPTSLIMNVVLPKSILPLHRLLARLVVLLGWPTHGQNRGLAILRVMECLAHSFHPSLPALWNLVIPSMIMYLNQQEFPGETPDSSAHRKEPYNQNHWEDLTLKMLLKSIEQVDDAKWNLTLLRAFEDQLPLYEKSPEEKGFLFKCLSIVLSKIQRQEVISESMEFILQSASHDVPLEQECCAVAFGYLSASHSDLLFNGLKKEIANLDSYTQPLKGSKSHNISVAGGSSVPRRLTSLFRSTSTTKVPSTPVTTRPLPFNFRGTIDQAKATVLKVYGHSIEHTRLEAIEPYIHSILKETVQPIVHSPEQSTCVKLAAVDLIRSIGKAFTHRAPESSECTVDYLVNLRTELLQYLLELLNQELGPGNDKGVSMASSARNTDVVLPFPPSSPSSNRRGSFSGTNGMVYCSAVLAAKEILHMGPFENLNYKQLLTVTARTILPLPSCPEPSYPSEGNQPSVSNLDEQANRRLSLVPVREESTASGYQAGSVPNEANDEMLWTKCVAALRDLWIHLLHLGCSDELISEMIKILVPYLHDPSSHVRLRALRLTSFILMDTLNELQILTKLGRGLSLGGELTVHITTLLGDGESRILRSQAKLALLSLLKIQQLFLSDQLSAAGTDSSDQNSVSPERTADRPLLSTDVLLCELAHAFPRPQLNAVIDLLLQAMTIPTTSACTDTAEPFADNYSTSSDDEEDSTYLGKNLDTIFSEIQNGTVTHRANAFLESSVKYKKYSLSWRSLKLPLTGSGHAVKLFIAVLHYRSSELTETQIAALLRSTHDIYQNTISLGLRAGILQGVAELGNRWPLVCLKAILVNRLPLDVSWSVMLGSIAFVPVGSAHSPGGSAATSVERPITNSPVRSTPAPHQQKKQTDTVGGHSGGVLPELLTHILKLLDYCLPYEKREIPVETVKPGDRRSVLSTIVADGPQNCEAYFATHSWLSLVNSLQILSYPLTMDELVRCSTARDGPLRVLASASISSPASDRPRKKRIFRRILSSSETPSTLSTQNEKPPLRLIDLSMHFASPHFFCPLLGHWMLAYATASACRTLIGKSYETRSGAEANLEIGYKPINIPTEGLRSFLDTCNLHTLLRHLGFKQSSQSTFIGDEKSRHRGSKRSSTPLAALSDSSKLANPEDLLEVIDIIARYVVQSMQSAYVFGLVQFFMHHLTSDYETNRIVATKFIGTVLSCGFSGPLTSLPFTSAMKGSADSMNLVSPVQSGNSSASDLLLTHLLNQLKDSSLVVRYVSVTSLGAIASYNRRKNSKSGEKGNPNPPDSVSEANSNVILLRRHASAIVSGLLLSVDERDNYIDPTFLSALKSLASVLPCVSEPQVRPVISDLCSRLLSIYSAPNDPVRVAAFNLFGTLTRFAWSSPLSETDPNPVPTPSWSTLSSEAESVFVPTVLHLADPCSDVVLACKSTLKMFAPLIFSADVDSEGRVTDDAQQNHTASADTTAKRLLDFIRTCIRPDTKLHLGEFFNELARLLVAHQPSRSSDYAMRCTVFFNSEWPEIQCSAILFAGSLMGHFTSDLCQAFPRSQVCHDLVQLLKMGTPEVRATAALAISRLHRF